MGVEVFSHDGGAFLFCNTSCVCFGPWFDKRKDAERFLRWCRENGVEPRDHLGRGQLKKMIAKSQKETHREASHDES